MISGWAKRKPAAQAEPARRGSGSVAVLRDGPLRKLRQTGARRSSEKSPEVRPLPSKIHCVARADQKSIIDTTAFCAHRETQFILLQKKKFTGRRAPADTILIYQPRDKAGKPQTLC